MSTKVVITIRHKLDDAEAMRRIRQRAEELQREHSFVIQNAHAEWGKAMSLFRVTALGHTFTAMIETTRRVARIEIEVPEAVTFLSDRLRAYFRREGQRILS